MDALSRYSTDPINLDARSWTFSDVYSVVYADAKPSMRLRLKTAYNRCEFLHRKRMVDVTVSDLDLAASLFAGQSHESQASFTMLISRIYQHLIRHDAVKRDLTPYIKMPEPTAPKDRVILDKDEIKAVLERGDEVMKLLLYTGMRINELLEMKMKDVYLDCEYPNLHVIKSKTSNGIRRIPIHKDVLDIVESQAGKEYLINPHLGYMHYMRHEWVKYGIEKNPRDFRRTFATYSKSCGMDDFFRRAIMGHSQKGITDRVYTDAMLPDMYRELQKLEYHTE